jgi:hypothetical protein
MVIKNLQPTQFILGLACMKSIVGAQSADLLHPTAAIAMLQINNIGQRPVKVIGNQCYLLVELIQGVA